MIKNIVCNGKEDYSFYLMCDCGGEILQFYYYKKSTYSDEKIGIKFFGHIDGSKNSYDRLVMINSNDLKTLVDAIKSDGSVFECGLGDSYFVVKHSNDGFIHIIKAKDEKRYSKDEFIWDIIIHKVSVNDLIEQINKMIVYIEKCN